CPEVDRGCRGIRADEDEGARGDEGGYFARRQEAILALLRRHAGDDSNARPLGRILSIDALPARMVVRTKGSPLVHRLTGALVRTHRGDLEIDYREGEDTLRAHWMRGAA
ncbi:BCAM0308 family protein, partial [Burkholderia pseudomallei]